MLVSDSLKQFLTKQRCDRNADLLDRVLAQGCDLEIQINVSPDGGELLDGTTSTYIGNGGEKWFSLRVPKEAYSNPHWRDYELSYPLSRHVDCIGSTGWNWKKRQSLWAAFDFDSIVGHAVGVGISDVELERVRTAVSALNYVEVRRSTGGRGLHLYVFLPDGVETANHHEHAAVARCILAELSRDVGFDLTTHVDVCGQNTWIWARRANDENKGFSLIKAATAKFPGDLTRWRDHIPVVKRHQGRVTVPGVSAKETDTFAQLTAAHRRIPLDPQHEALINELGSYGCCIWVNDHHLLQTHTALLERVHKEGKLPIRGVFTTNSPGTDTASANCFMYPTDNGGWKVFRFGVGSREAATWTQDGKGWTWCTYNANATLESAAVACGAKATQKGGYEFTMLRDATEMIKTWLVADENFEVPMPEQLVTRRAVVNKSGTSITIQVARAKDDVDMPGWNSSDRNGYWTLVLEATQAVEGVSAEGYDDRIRCLETPEGSPAGWCIRKQDAAWGRKQPSSVKMVLQSMGHDKPTAEIVMGSCETSPWKLVTIPFSDEYPGDRQWNLDAPQLRFAPAPPNDGQETLHPTWDLVLNHVGQSLDAPLRRAEWAQAAGVVTGRQYLQCWFASVLREPFSSLPYLFLYGPQNSGKSILHESFELLVTKGCTKADLALTSQFNAELEGCILAIVEEHDIAQVKGAYAKIKDAVTSPMLLIRRMRTDAYQVPNSTHWVQCSNDVSACPIFPGDSRITMLLVPEIDKEIPKAILKQRLKDEAPHFLATLFATPLPPLVGRLRIPVVVTDDKAAVIALNSNQVELFVSECCEIKTNNEVSFNDFMAAFLQYLPAGLAEDWTKSRVSKALLGINGVRLRSGTGNQRVVKGVRIK